MKLEKYGLTEAAILEGEFAEFEPVVNNRKEKREVYLKEIVDTVVQDAFDDLRTTLEENKELRAEVEKLTAELEASNRLLHQARADAGIKESDEAQLKRAENVLADLEHQVDQFKQKRQQDAAHIAQLEQQLSQLNHDDELEQLHQQIIELEQRDAQRDADYQSLADDVNDVLDSLESKFADLIA